MSIDDMDGGINTGRVIVGGLAAGVVINAGEVVANMFLFEEDVAAALDGLGLAQPDTSAIGWFIAIGFALGIGTAWQYAAMRDRFGPGPRTGVCAGLAVWGFYYLLPSLMMAVGGMYPLGFAVKIIAFSAPVMCIAGYLAGMFYIEEWDD